MEDSVMTIRTALLAAVAVAALTAPASAGPEVKFTFEGQTWTIIGSSGAPVTRVDDLMTPGAARRCPNRVVKLEARRASTGTTAQRMTTEQKFAGDKRWHIVCQHSEPERRAEAAAPPPVAARPAAGPDVVATRPAPTRRAPPAWVDPRPRVIPAVDNLMFTDDEI